MSTVGEPEAHRGAEEEVSRSPGIINEEVRQPRARNIPSDIVSIEHTGGDTYVAIKC